VTSERDNELDLVHRNKQMHPVFSLKGEIMSLRNGSKAPQIEKELVDEVTAPKKLAGQSGLVILCQYLLHSNVVQRQ
jgi:hypothetical protein